MRAGVMPAGQAAGVAHSCRRIDQQKCVDAAAAAAREACGGHLPHSPHTHFAARAVRWVRFVSTLNPHYLSTEVTWDVMMGVFFFVTLEGTQCLHLREDPLDIAKTQMVRILKRTTVKVQVKITLEQGKKAQRGSRRIALLFL